MRTTNAVRRVLHLGVLGLVLVACRQRASSIPLGGTHEEELLVAKRAGSAAPSAGPNLPLEAEEAQAAAQADEASVTTPVPVEIAHEPSKAAGPGAFRVVPYVAHQAWTRSSDLEFALKVGPGGSIDMKMVTHQETRFEVLSVNGGAIDKLQIEYPIYKSNLTIMGASQDAPEDLAGKRFVVTFARGLLEVRDASGGKPPKKQVDSVKDDAREPQEIEKALKELSLLAGKGQGDFTGPGAVSLAGGEDEDTKVSRAQAKLLRLSTGSHNEKLALLQLGYTLTNDLEDKVTIEVQVSGTQTVIDAPARYQTSTLQGPMELRSAEAGGMQGRGTVKITTSYKY
jgi:hypothetical protein